ncbi:aldose epimerase family protein [Amedibacillus sp. YH-ame10]
MITSRQFDKDNTEVYEYTLQSEQLTVRVLNLGCIITSVIYNDTKEDVVLGYDTLEEYQKDKNFFGAMIGRCANRIRNGKFSLNGNDYNLNVNDNMNSLHGGPTGFHTRVFKAEIDDETIHFYYTSKDMEEGFPGKLNLRVSMRLIENDLEIEYEAISDADTIINFTNHSYFALQGAGKGSVEHQIIKSEASLYGESDCYCLATGKLSDVEGTPFDFRNGRVIGQDINNMQNEQIKMIGGYDHYMRFGSNDKKAVALLDQLSGHQLIVESDLPGFHFYVPNYQPGQLGKGGNIYEGHCAVCLETTFLPDAINLQENPETILRKDQLFETKTTYRFL